jgi:hypothetical protein
MPTQITLTDEHNKCFALLLTTFLFLVLSTTILTGQDNTLYLMPGIPQANQLNPAIFKKCRIYIELPVISSIRLNVRNSGFSYHDAAYFAEGAYHLNLSNLDKKLKSVNNFQTESDINLLGVGLGVNDWYFTFGIANHSDELLTYPHDIILLRDANLQVINGLSKPINLSKLSSEVTVWNSIGISAAKKLNDQLSVGVRVKYLQGMANAISRQSDLLFNSSNNPISLAASMNYNIYSSFPVALQFSPTGQLNKLNFDNSTNNFVSNFIFNGNRGAAIDAGFVFDVDEKTEFSASFIDLGFIRWKKNTNNFSTSGNILVNGAQLLQLYVSQGQVDLIRALRDTISRSLTVAGGQRYYTLIPLKIFGGVTREILTNLRAGAMTRIEIYDNQIMPSLSFSMNYTPIPAVAASLSYTIMNNKFNQIGAGIAVGNRGAQFYVVTDNIPIFIKVDPASSLIWPYYARMFSMRVGLNLLFACKQKETKHHHQGGGGDKSCPAYN